MGKKKSGRLTFIQKLLWSNVTLAPAESRGHVYRRFPWQTIHCRGPVVTDLQARKVVSDTPTCNHINQVQYL